MKPLMIAIAAASLVFGSAMAQDHSHHHNHKDHTTLGAAQVSQEDSIYHLDGEWQTHTGETIQLAELQGQPVLVSMIYGSCTTACPVLVNDARRVYQALPEAYRKHVKLLMVSFDQDRDTPAALAEYANKYGLGENVWLFLHGQDDNIRALATLLGVRYRKRADGDFDHSNLVTVLDTKGRIVQRTEGLNRPVDEAVAALMKVIDDNHLMHH
ncbi:SCO family protein [Pseudidiomarina donghaiensis]|uniref:SCO family protein n=2 Tax=Pseudidiomarina donghaiensis TaxID=519452 RepID=A0A432XBD1_9GAMM|nr:SCO family protein [Pseudidiomarina donghaiensis]RUO46059.1 SCO family protein [Pseudidiomarina donghaiensis]SFV24987.1 protein SCO1/2 [Pseudidiomarina donghaiensis]